LQQLNPTLRRKYKVKAITLLALAVLVTLVGCSKESNAPSAPDSPPKQWLEEEEAALRQPRPPHIGIEGIVTLNHEPLAEVMVIAAPENRMFAPDTAYTNAHGYYLFSFGRAVGHSCFGLTVPDYPGGGDAVWWHTGELVFCQIEVTTAGSVCDDTRYSRRAE
jgi:hypothetical protein